MTCARCRGFVIIDGNFWLGEEYEPEAFLPRHCVNCGWMEDPVMRANRLAGSHQDGLIPAVARSRRLLG